MVTLFWLAAAGAVAVTIIRDRALSGDDESPPRVKWTLAVAAFVAFVVWGSFEDDAANTAAELILVACLIGLAVIALRGRVGGKKPNGSAGA